MADPYAVAELKRVIPEILWTRTYFAIFLKAYPELGKSSAHIAPAASAADTDDVLAKPAIPMMVKRFLNSPLAFFNKTEGPDRDPTWLQSLPNDALRLFMKHALDLAQGFYQPEIKGALSGPAAEKFTLEKFLQSTRVNTRFATQFSIAYDSLVGKPSVASAAAAGENTNAQAGQPEEGTANVGASINPDSKEKSKHDGSKDLLEVSAFRRQCESYCLRELEARLLTLVAKGTHLEINANITSTRLYKNLTESVPLMGFYDVKNAKLCNVFEGEGFCFHSFSRVAF